VTKTAGIAVYHGRFLDFRPSGRFPPPSPIFRISWHKFGISNRKKTNRTTVSNFFALLEHCYAVRVFHQSLSSCSIQANVQSLACFGA